MKVKVIIAIMAVAGMGMSAVAGIEGSAHDFSGNAWSGGEICVVCHTPHTDVAGGFGPLWNRTAYTNTTFSHYTSGTLTHGELQTRQPGTQSKACLSCHDGSVALDNFGGNTTGTVTIATTHQVGVGGDLTDEHPIGFTYDVDLATTDGGLHNPTNAAVASLLFSGQLECASCHDVHNDLGVAGLLRVDNAGSDLCLTCHDK